MQLWGARRGGGEGGARITESCVVSLGGSFETRETGKAQIGLTARAGALQNTSDGAAGFCCTQEKKALYGCPTLDGLIPPQTALLLYSNRGIWRLSSLSGLLWPREREYETRGAARAPSLHTAHSLTCSYSAIGCLHLNSAADAAGSVMDVPVSVLNSAIYVL